MRHEVARTVVCYGYIVNKPAVPSAESIGTGVTGNGRVGSRWNKVQTLQRLLTHSFSGKALAVKRVTENQGRRTPGVDGVTWSTPEQKAAAIRALRQRGY